MIRRLPFLALTALAIVLASIPAHADPLQTVAKHLSKGLTGLKTKRIAVLPFRYHNGDISSGSSYVSERMTTLMVQRGGAQVVERELLDKAMSEIKLGMTGMIDPATTQKLGKVLGVPAIVTGTLIDFEGRETEVNARLIETETGSILAAETARIPRTWEDLPHPDHFSSPSSAVPASDHDADYHVLASKAIPNSPGPGRHAMPPIYDNPMTTAMATGPTPLLPEGDVLTLTNSDLIPVNRRGQTDPERILNDVIADQETPTPADIHIARRIYHRNPSPKVRARALVAMGNILERNGLHEQATQAYAQVLREFPDSPELQTEARRRLDNTASR